MTWVGRCGYNGTSEFGGVGELNDFWAAASGVGGIAAVLALVLTVWLKWPEIRERLPKWEKRRESTYQLSESKPSYYIPVRMTGVKVWDAIDGALVWAINGAILVVVEGAIVGAIAGAILGLGAIVGTILGLGVGTIVGAIGWAILGAIDGWRDI